MKILVMNAGSSSQKSALHELSEPTRADAPSPPLWEAQIDWTRQQDAAELEVTTAQGAALQETLQAESRPAAVARMLETLWSGPTQTLAGPGEIDCVGHRVVHGGREYQASARVTPEVKAAITRSAELAPAHNPANLEGIEVIEAILGDAPQVAVFDTAFHSRLPEPAAVYPGPYAWVEQGIRRYGFHGISHQYCAQRAAQLLGRDLASLRLLTCHLGNGCSLAAIRDGRSVDTTMGFTPLDGLMMGTRPGALDPGILLHLLRRQGESADRLDRILHKESGLLGLSGVSGDMRQIAAALAKGDPRAQLAFDVFMHRLRFHIGAMLPSLGGLDALVFTAGIGENSATVRAAACEPFGFLGLRLDAAKNARVTEDADIAASDSTVRILVIRTQEDWAIAQECLRLVGP